MEQSISTLVNQMVEEHNKKMNQVLLDKFEDLKGKAFEQKEYGLYQILKDIDLLEIEKTQRLLELHGYSLELEQPVPEFTCNDNILKASLRVDKIKLKVRKVIFEV